jgi:hypothetical protein
MLRDSRDFTMQNYFYQGSEKSFIVRLNDFNGVSLQPGPIEFQSCRRLLGRPPLVRSNASNRRRMFPPRSSFRTDFRVQLPTASTTAVTCISKYQARPASGRAVRSAAKADEELAPLAMRAAANRETVALIWVSILARLAEQP